MTWAFTGQIAAMAAFLAVAGLAYLKWLSWDFDRRYGKPRRADPAE